MYLAQTKSGRPGESNNLLVQQPSSRHSITSKTSMAHHLRISSSSLTLKFLTTVPTQVARRFWPTWRAWLLISTSERTGEQLLPRTPMQLCFSVIWWTAEGWTCQTMSMHHNAGFGSPEAPPNLRLCWFQIRGLLFPFQRYFSHGQSYIPVLHSWKSWYGVWRINLSHRTQSDHLTRLQSRSVFSPLARSRYISHFGPLNNRASISNHTLLFFDAPGFVQEDYERAGQRKSFAEWRPKVGGPFEFVRTVGEGDSSIYFVPFNSSLSCKNPVNDLDPAVLFTHIPLYRPDGKSCGPLREKGTIRPGVGFGYQNTLGKDSTSFVLHQMRPTVVFR